MALNRVHTWIAGEVLTASDLNTEFNNYITNVASLVTPVAFDLTFTDATYDIGKSGATRPRDGFFSRNVTIGGTFTPGSTTGTTTNDSAAAGKLGEVLDGSVASGSAQGLTNTTPFNCVTLALTAGDWEVSGMGAFTPNAATTFTWLAAALSTVSASQPELQTAQVSFPNTMTGGSNQQLVPPPLRVSLAAGANVYLVTAAAFAVNVMNTWGKIHARRVR